MDGEGRSERGRKVVKEKVVVEGEERYSREEYIG